MSYRGHKSKITFDFDDGMGDSTCVACGECVQVCPTGALIEKSLVNEDGKRVNYSDKSVESLCPFCGVGCQTEVHVKDDKILHVDGRNGHFFHLHAKFYHPLHALQSDNQLHRMDIMIPHFYHYN